MCSKINPFASKNEFIIGADLYESVKTFSDYSFSSRGTFDVELDGKYAVYAVTRK